MGFFDTIKNAMSLDDEDDDSLYEAEMRELERKEKNKAAKSRRNSDSSDGYEDDEEEDTAQKRASRSSFSDRRNSERGRRPARSNAEKKTDGSYRSSYESSRTAPPRSPESSYYGRKPSSGAQRHGTGDNIVRMRRDSASDISILKLQSLSDAQEVCDNLVEGKPIIVSFEDPKGPEAQRIMDFISGCIYVLNGNLHTISDSIFLFSPKGVDVSGDYLNLMQNNGFGVPTFNKMI